MRQAGEEYLAAYDGFSSIEGSAESTTLEDASVDFVTAGQAFHWFEPEKTRAEFRRILRPQAGSSPSGTSVKWRHLSPGRMKTFS